MADGGTPAEGGQNKRARVDDSPPAVELDQEQQDITYRIGNKTYYSQDAAFDAISEVKRTSDKAWWRNFDPKKLPNGEVKVECNDRICRQTFAIGNVRQRVPSHLHQLEDGTYVCKKRHQAGENRPAVTDHVHSSKPV